MQETVTPRQAALEARCLAQQIYSAIAMGKLRVRRIAGRVQIDRDSFNQWKAKLEIRRGLRDGSAA